MQHAQRPHRRATTGNGHDIPEDLNDRHARHHAHYHHTQPATRVPGPAGHNRDHDVFVLDPINLRDARLSFGDVRAALDATARRPEPSAPLRSSKPKTNADLNATGTSTSLPPPMRREPTARATTDATVMASSTARPPTAPPRYSSLYGGVVVPPTSTSSCTPNDTSDSGSVSVEWMSPTMSDAYHPSLAPSAANDGVPRRPSEHLSTLGDYPPERRHAVYVVPRPWTSNSPALPETRPVPDPIPRAQTSMFMRTPICEDSDDDDDEYDGDGEYTYESDAAALGGADRPRFRRGKRKYLKSVLQRTFPFGPGPRE